MTPSLSAGLRIGAACLIAAAWNIGAGAPARAQQPPPAAAPAPGAPAPEAAPGPTAMTTPGMSGPLVANPDPFHLDVTPWVGTVYVTGAASGLALTQTNRVPGIDRRTTFDISNAQASLQTTEGLFQFFLQPGVYALPVVGVPYSFSKMDVATNLFGGLPIAWGKIVPTDTFSIQGGKLPTLIGAEYMFTFQNMNIQRGLLWNQEPVVSRGAQANLTTGPVAWSASLNDGYYSGKYNWLTGSAAWTINSANSLAVTGGGAFSRNAVAGPATPVAQNNSSIVEAHYTYNNAPWTFVSHIQYTQVSADAALGFGQDASTIGGAVLASYKFNDYFSLAGRVEYIDSSGGATAANLLGYGPGSSAASFTLTPTFQNGMFFLRGEASLTEIYSITPGAGFGTGNGRTQGRFMVETGLIF